MKASTKNEIKTMSFDLKKTWKIEQKLIKDKENLNEKEVKLLKKQANSGEPLSQFLYGLYFYLDEASDEKAEYWYNIFFYCANGRLLYHASTIFALLNDEYWSMKCLRRSAWKKHSVAMRMLKAMKKTPYVPVVEA